MGVSFKSAREAIIDIFTLIGYAEKMIPYLYYLNISLQFIWFYILIILNENSELNTTITSVRDALLNLLNYPLTAPIINIVFVSLSLVFGLVCILYKNQSEAIQSLSSNNSSAFKLSEFISKIHIFLNFLSIPCLIINFTSFDLSNRNQSQSLFNNSVFILIIAIINICLVAFSHLSYSERLLLGKWTFPLVLLSIRSELIIIPLKIISILAIFTHSIKKPTFERILIRLLLFISIMDFISMIASYKINLMHFIMFNIIIIISEFMYHQQINRLQVEQQNEILFYNLQQLSKNKKIDKKNQIILMRIVFKNKQRIEQNSSYFHSAKTISIKDIFQNINVNSFQWLSNFIKIKFDLNIKETPHKTIIKLYRIIFAIHYETLTVNILHSLMTLNKDFQNFTFKDRIIMKQIQDLLNKKYLKKKQEVRNYEVVTINKNIEEFYKVFIQAIEIMPAYWYKFRFNSLTQQDMFQLLVEEVSKENKITKYMEEIVKYKHSQIQIKIYDYVMKLLNFDYEPKIMTKGDIEFGKADFGLSHYICLTQNKISDVSNRLLIELKRKKEQLHGENVEILVPRQLKHFLQSKFENALQTVKEPPEFIMPFIQMREFLLPYIIKIDLKFNYSSGLTYVIHFLKSLELQQSPCFLYSLDNDQIVNSCPLFLEYLQLLKRKVNFNLLGNELFGFDLGQEITVNKKTINDKIPCYLKRQKEKQQNLALVLIIKNIYQSGNHRYVLFQIQRKNIPIVSKQQTIQNLVYNTQSQKDQVKNYKQNYKNQQFFCKIPNPYESLLSEKMNKLNMNCRKSNLKYITIIAVVLLCFLLAGIIFVNVQVQGQISSFQDLYNLSSQTSSQKQNIYLLPLILYQYFQIKNFPTSLQKIQNYDFEKLKTAYIDKVNSQISTLSPYPFTSLLQKNNKYTLIYPNYQKTLQTNPSSILDFMTIAKKSLATNNMNFVIRNQQALDIILKSYKRVSMDPFDDYKDSTYNIIFGFFGAFAFLTVLIKFFAIKTRLLAREFFALYSKLSKKQIKNIIQKYEELLMAGKYSLYSKNDYDCNKKALEYQNGFSLKSVSSQELQQINASGGQLRDNVIKNNEKGQKNSVSCGNKIKNTSNGKLLLKYSYIFIIPVICCSYFMIYLVNIQQYQKAASFILQKNINLKNFIVTITQKAQKFYQASMIEQIIVNPPNNWTVTSTQNFTVNFQLELPSEFADYVALQKKMINYDICKNLEPNTDPLFEGVNCYDILNGVMSKGIIQTYALYCDIIKDYGGLLMSKFSQEYRSNAKYPVFFQILYIRHSVCNILRKLQDSFNKTSLICIQNQNEKISSNLMKGLILLPVLIGFALILILNLHKESQAIIKCFRVLPRDFLLDIKITKFLKNQEILDKIQMIPF